MLIYKYISMSAYFLKIGSYDIILNFKLLKFINFWNIRFFVTKINTLSTRFKIRFVNRRCEQSKKEMQNISLKPDEWLTN